jgi:cell division protein FtsQ
MAVFLKIEKIEVKGNGIYTKEQIIDASGISIGDNLYAINKKTARSFITTEYPYIKEVVIRRNLPTTLVFKITEEQPVYYTEICGEYFVLSKSLRILERTYEKPSNEENPLVLLLLADVKRAVVGETLEFEKELTFEYINNFMQSVNEHEIADKLTEIDISNKYNIYVSYQGRFRIYLGDSTETDMKLKFAELMINTFEQDKRGTVDAHDITVGSVILDN